MEFINAIFILLMAESKQRILQHGICVSNGDSDLSSTSSFNKCQNQKFNYELLLNPEYDYYSYCDNIYLAKYLFKKLTIWFKYTTHIAHGNIKFSVIIHITGRETINMNTFSLNLSTDQVVNNFMYSCASFFTVPMEL